MTHPNHQTNGASLEDCHTNFFALTDLCGIKWRKLVWGESLTSPEPLEDPVLSSYARCLAVDILCVWRRVATQVPGSASAAAGGLFDSIGLPPGLGPGPPASQGQSHPPLSLNAAKELWIFWYGEEPDLSGLVAPELLASDGEQGSWESGLSYECRSLLFKSLHNLIERCLLTRDFVRIGKWFVQAHDGTEKVMGKTTHFSFSFSFFVHGESTVCASMDVRTHPLVRNFTRQHLAQAQSSTSGIPVLLAPFGLAGTVMGQTCKGSDLQVQRLFEDWKHFYPVDSKYSARDGGEEAGLPKFIEVIVGGVKMRYPTCYILATDMDNPETSPDSTVAEQAAPSAVSTGYHPHSVQLEAPPSTRLSDHVWQDAVLNPAQHEQPAEHNGLVGDGTANQQPPPGHWDFVDPTRKAPCICPKCKKSPSMKQLSVNKGIGSKGEKVGEKGGRSIRVTPFHRRSPLADEGAWAVEVAPPLSRLSGSGTPSGGPPSYPRGQSMTPNPAPNIHGDSMPVPSVGSPPSAAPSPLPNPHSQPASVPPADPTMPTLSPHPPTSAQPQPSTPQESQEKVTPAATPTDINGPKSVSSVSNQVYSPYPATPSVEPAMKPIDSVGGSQGPASAPAPQPTYTPEYTTLKRPVLSSKEYESILMEEEQPSQLLYDYSTLNAWLDHPVKRFKSSDLWSGEPMKPPQYPQRSSTNEVYAGQQQSLTAAGSPPSNAATPPFIKVEMKSEPGNGVSMEIDGVRLSKKRSDPYEFDDDGAAPAVSMEGFKRTNSVKEEDRKGDSDAQGDDAAAANGSGKTPGNLFTNEGLQASYRDLEQIFDNSDDTSSDEALQVPTPPDSNKPSGVPEDTAALLVVKPPRGSGGNSSLNSCSGAGILRPEELSKMFPTPPSLEHNPISSPCGHLPSDISLTELTEPTRYKQEIYPNMGSPQEELVDDWSYVFKPPTRCQYVGSSKYAPLTNLPSQNQPPVTLPPNCVYKPSSWQYSHSTSEKSTPAMSHSLVPMNPARPNSVGHTPTPVPHPHHQHPSHPHHPPLPHPRAGLSPISPAAHFPPSPLAMGNMAPIMQQFRGNSGVRTPCPPPPPYELPSPATSNASSYLNKNLNSVEPVSVPRTPEANSLVVNILLSDTSINIFRDHNFDSCTLCVCNAGPKVVGNIRGADAGTYLLTPLQALLPSSFPPNSPYPNLTGGQPPYTLPGASPGGHHPPLAGPLDEDPIRCSCGFSAVVNRRLSHRSGLFYEDEQEITGIAEDPSERKKGSLLSYLQLNKNTQENGASDIVDNIPQSLLELVREQCVLVQSSSNSLCRASKWFRNKMIPFGTSVNILEFTDSNEITYLALEQSRQALLESTTVSMCKVEEMQQRQQQMQHKSSSSVLCVHRWAFLRARGPHCNQDIVRVMKSLQPLLQEAIQKKCQTRLWEAPYTVSGPLTWRQFHRLAGRGADDRCEPQPIPSLVVGYEKDWLSLSPFAIPLWEKLLLEPYSYTRDVAYIVVAPDNEFVLQKVRTFFKELSATYELCRLGRHCPITKVLRDGILRVGKSSAAKLGKEAVDDWFMMLGDTPTTNMLKLYAQVCRHHLGPYLSQVPMDRTLLESPDSTAKSNVDRPMPSPMPPPSTPETPAPAPEKAPSTPKAEHEGEACSRDPLLTGGPLSGGDASHDEDEQEAPAVVVYIIDPFTIGSDNVDLQRLGCLGLLRCFSSVVSALPENARNNVSVQVISLESILELGNSRDRIRHNDHMRAQAFSVFSQCRRMLTHMSNIKALTGFGTAAMADLFLKNKDEKNRAPYRLYTPPYILAPVKEKVESGESFGQQGLEQCSVLYVSYCLSEDQRWLLAVITDERGEMLETATINIDIPNRRRRKKASARRIGLQKLMDFILGVMSQSVQPWRLVIGRIGRIGHGELKGWSWLLSRKSLLKASKHLKEICGQCSLMYPSDVPCVLSACLVSLEPDSTLRLMPDQFTPDERFSTTSVNCQLTTPLDVTCTHILVFPTSATTQSSQTAFQEQHINGLGDDDFMSALNDDMPEGIEGMQDLQDIFTWTDPAVSGLGGSPTGSPRRGDSPSQPGSPSCGLGGPSSQHSPGFPCPSEPQEEVGTLHQQPLALGYFVSTAPLGRMPQWFWASCPHLEDVCPAFLKNALHLHSPAIQQNDDLLQQQSAITVHPLDSQYTTDVLRYVLEGYNALSWLSSDSNTRDRLSCLPVHIQALMQLYHMTAALV